MASALPFFGGDDEFEEFVLARRERDRMAMGVVYGQDVNRVARMQGFYERVVPTYSGRQFASHFRMYPATFEELARFIAPMMPQSRTCPVDKKLLGAIWILANQTTYRDVADRFDMDPGYLFESTIQVCVALNQRMAEVICWPNQAGLNRIQEGFQAICGFPGVVGAIDGTYVSMLGPRNEHRASFICRKTFPSLQLQVVSDHNMRFLDVYTGFPGSVHDARVYRNSDVPAKIAELREDQHILGDSAYPQQTHLMTPYREDGHMLRFQKKYNNKQSKTRVKVEQSIGLLKGKFRKLKDMQMKDSDSMKVLMTACCVIHNFILEHGMDEQELNEYYAGMDDDEREELDEPIGFDISGIEKRDNIAALLS